MSGYYFKLGEGLKNFSLMDLQVGLHLKSPSYSPASRYLHLRELRRRGIWQKDGRPNGNWLWVGNQGVR